MKAIQSAVVTIGEVVNEPKAILFYGKIYLCKEATDEQIADLINKVDEPISQ